MATHSSVLAWRIPGTGEPGGLLSMGSQSRTRLKRCSSSRSWAEGEIRKCQSMSTKLHLWKINKLCRSNVQQCDYSNNTILCSWNLSMVKVKDTYSCLTLYDSMDYTVYGILQARILEWVAFISSPGALPNSRIKPRSPRSPALPSIFPTFDSGWHLRWGDSWCLRP